MNIVAVLSLAVGLGVAPAYALPLPSAGGDDTPRAEGQAPEGLIREANIVGRDDRGSIDHFSSTVSASEQHWLAQVTGWVECQSTATFPGTSGSASLVGSNAKIVTVAHNFFDERRNLPNPLPRCTFRTKANPRHKIPLVFEPGRYVIGATTWDASRDYAIVALAEPVRGVTPLNFGPAPSQGDQLLLITSQAGSARKHIDTSKPVARLCTVHKAFSSFGNANSFFRGDCDTSAGDSGGIYLARRSGRLTAVGLHHGGGMAQANGLPFDDMNPDTAHKSYSLGIAFGPVMLQDFSRVR